MTDHGEFIVDRDPFDERGKRQREDVATSPLKTKKRRPPQGKACFARLHANPPVRSPNTICVPLCTVMAAHDMWAADPPVRSMQVTNSSLKEANTTAHPIAAAPDSIPVAVSAPPTGAPDSQTTATSAPPRAEKCDAKKGPVSDAVVLNRATPVRANLSFARHTDPM